MRAISQHPAHDFPFLLPQSAADGAKRRDGRSPYIGAVFVRAVCCRASPWSGSGSTDCCARACSRCWWHRSVGVGADAAHGADCAPGPRFGLASIYPCLMARTPQRVSVSFAAHAVGFPMSAAHPRCRGAAEPGRLDRAARRSRSDRRHRRGERRDARSAARVAVAALRFPSGGGGVVSFPSEKENGRGSRPSPVFALRGSADSRRLF